MSEPANNTTKVTDTMIVMVHQARMKDFEIWKICLYKSKNAALIEYRQHHVSEFAANWNTIDSEINLS